MRSSTFHSVDDITCTAHRLLRNVTFTGTLAGIHDFDGFCVVVEVFVLRRSSGDVLSLLIVICLYSSEVDDVSGIRPWNDADFGPDPLVLCDGDMVRQPSLTLLPVSPSVTPSVEAARWPD